jgi:hypothetical protein
MGTYSTDLHEILHPDTNCCKPSLEIGGGRPYLLFMS